MLLGPEAPSQRARGVLPDAVVQILGVAAIGPGVALLHHPGIDVFFAEEDHRNRRRRDRYADDARRTAPCRAGSGGAGQVVSPSITLVTTAAMTGSSRDRASKESRQAAGRGRDCLNDRAEPEQAHPHAPSARIMPLSGREFDRSGDSSMIPGTMMTGISALTVGAIAVFSLFAARRLLGKSRLPSPRRRRRRPPLTPNSNRSRSRPSDTGSASTSRSVSSYIRLSVPARWNRWHAGMFLYVL